MPRPKKSFQTYHWRMFGPDIARADFLQEEFTKELSLDRPYDMAKIIRKLIHDEAKRRGYKDPA